MNNSKIFGNLWAYGVSDTADITVYFLEMLLAKVSSILQSKEV